MARLCYPGPCRALPPSPSSRWRCTACFHVRVRVCANALDCASGLGRYVLVLQHHTSRSLIPYPAGTSTRLLQACDCRTWAQQLVSLGYFPSAPVRPSVAFSVRLLELISVHSLNVAPNITAWATTLESFWARRGFTIDERVRADCSQLARGADGVASAYFARGSVTPCIGTKYLSTTRTTRSQTRLWVRAPSSPLVTASL